MWAYLCDSFSYSHNFGPQANGDTENLKGKCTIMMIKVQNVPIRVTTPKSVLLSTPQIWLMKVSKKNWPESGHRG